MRRARLPAVLGLLVVAAGCKKPTEMVVYVNADNLVVVGRDFDFVHFRVSAKADDFAFFDSPPICIGSSGGCKRLPITVTLVPGPRDPNATVRVQVDATRRLSDGTYLPVISDAALFTFTSSQSQRLDFTLYAACLNRAEACSTKDKFCRSDGLCVDLAATGGSPEDMAVPRDLGADGASDMPVSDMAQPDMGAPDLSGFPDLWSSDACVDDMGILVSCSSTL